MTSANTELSAAARASLYASETEPSAERSLKIAPALARLKHFVGDSDTPADLAGF